jgi:hypothetical protein
MFALQTIEVQGILDRSQHLFGDVADPPLLEAGVVVDAHPGKDCDLFAAEPPLAAANRRTRQPDLVGIDRRASRRQKLTQTRGSIHAPIVDQQVATADDSPGRDGFEA